MSLSLRNVPVKNIWSNPQPSNRGVMISSSIWSNKRAMYEFCFAKKFHEVGKKLMSRLMLQMDQ